MNRLSLWIALATMPIAVFAVYAVGFHWLALVGLLNVPPVLATMLLLRAGVQWWRGQPWALQCGNREILGGAAGFLTPLLFLLAWNVAREAGVLRTNLYTTSSQHTYTTMWHDWKERAAATLPAAGTTVDAPQGEFGDGLRDALRMGWLGGDGLRLHASVATDYEPPSTPWPLWKSAAVACRFTMLLELQAPDPGMPVRAAEVTLDVEGTWTMYGLASQRDYHHWLGKTLGNQVRAAMFKHASKAIAK